MTENNTDDVTCKLCMLNLPNLPNQITSRHTTHAYIRIKQWYNTFPTSCFSLLALFIYFSLFKNKNNIIGVPMEKLM
jgi:hypothetical protein